MGQFTKNCWGTGLALALCVGGSPPAQGKPKAEQAAILPAPVAPAVAYVPSENRHVRIAVDEVVAANSSGYLPKDKQWLQLKITVTNKSTSTIGFSEIRERQGNGVVLQAATSSGDLSKPPSMTGSAGKSIGISSAGMAAGYMIAPPLALVAGAAQLFGTTLGFDKKQKRNRLIDQTILRATPLAPGTAASGWAYVPAVQDHVGLIAFYSIDGRLESLSIPRLGYAPTPVLTPAPPAAEAKAPLPRSRSVRRRR